MIKRRKGELKKKLSMLVIFVACMILPSFPTAMAEEPTSSRIDNPNPLTGNSTLIWTVSPTSFCSRYLLPGQSLDLVVTISNDLSSDTTWDWDSMVFASYWHWYGDFVWGSSPPPIDPGNSWTGTIGTFTVLLTTPYGTQVTLEGCNLTIHCSISGAQPEYYNIPITIIAGLEGDINADEIVDIFDVVIAANAFGSRPGDPNWDPRADFKPECGLIDIFDLVVIGVHFGEIC